MDVELAFNFLDVLFVWEQRKWKVLQSVLMAYSHSNGELCPHSNVLDYQSGSPSLRATPHPHPQLQRTKSCTVCHSGTAGCFPFYSAAVSATAAEMSLRHLKTNGPKLNTSLHHSPCSNPPSSCAPYFSKCHHHLPRCTSQKRGGSLWPFSQAASNQPHVLLILTLKQCSEYVHLLCPTAIHSPGCQDVIPGWRNAT